MIHIDAGDAIHSHQPVVVGGVGGSGTRLIAQILGSEGFFLGSDLNEASDNLWFTLLFKRPEILACTDREWTNLCNIFVQGMIGGSAFSEDQRATVRQLAASGRLHHDAQWLSARAISLLSQRESHELCVRWGWKEPNTHIVLDRLAKSFATMKYIFVSRHGLDMALSTNQNQAQLWGPLILGEPFESSSRYALRYWCQIHRRALRTGGELGGRFLLVKYDDLCCCPAENIARLRAFLGIDESSVLTKLLDIVKPPVSIGRHRFSHRSDFDEDDVAYADSLGYEIRCR